MQASRAGGAGCYLGPREPVLGVIEAVFSELGSWLYMGI